MSQFESWLSGKLKALGTDESVFLPYIMSILEGDETEEEKTEGLQAILADFVSSEKDIEDNLNQITSQWKSEVEKSQSESQDALKKKVPQLDINDQLHQIMEEKMSNFSLKKVEKTEEEKKMKAAILASYSQVADGDSEDDGDDAGGDGEDLLSNNNAETVAKAQAEWRESQKQAAMAKREKDKQDREAQKKKDEDRKKKAQEKTAKGERRSGR